MVSALEEIDSVVRCIEMRAEDYLLKPRNPILLRARIAACLEKKRLDDDCARVKHRSYLASIAIWYKKATLYVVAIVRSECILTQEYFFS